MRETEGMPDLTEHERAVLAKLDELMAERVDKLVSDVKRLEQALERITMILRRINENVDKLVVRVLTDEIAMGSG